MCSALLSFLPFPPCSLSLSLSLLSADVDDDEVFPLSRRALSLSLPFYRVYFRSSSLHLKDLYRYLRCWQPLDRISLTSMLCLCTLCVCICSAVRVLIPGVHATLLLHAPSHRHHTHTQIHTHLVCRSQSGKITAMRFFDDFFLLPVLQSLFPSVACNGTIEKG